MARKKIRMIIRGANIAQVEKRIKDMERRGWKPVMAEPKYDPGSVYAFDPTYVMVMEHPTLKRSGVKVWY